MTQIDILILSNGPGEVTTWVRPVVKALRQKFGIDPEQARISVVLSPCPNASGKEADIARSYIEVDRVQSAEYFFSFLLWGKTQDNWDWRENGVVVFLGGDQFFPVVIGKKLNYRTVVYAEWDARWHNLIDRFGVMNAEVVTKVAPKYAHKFTVVGDLMVATPELPLENSSVNQELSELIGILPGSKPSKLAQGVPLTVAIAEYVHAKRPQTKFVLPVAPTLDLETLVSFADPEKNAIARYFGFKGGSLVGSESQGTKGDAGKLTPNSSLLTVKGLSVELHTEYPAYDVLSQCCICLTTVGANTAELGSLGVPMIVLLPTQQLDAMRSWDGLPGLLANLPIFGSGFAKLINWMVLSRRGLLAWPNIWAQEMIVPELVGKLQPQEVAEMVLDYLENPEKLEAIRAKLRSVRGEPGAAQKIAEIVWEVRSLE
ncbi:MAG: lipid-A-disaccharide synthase [Cyanomargarita calcarea GSE-NOS-MK-12-04C]|jgi:lipid-A-disaccharide synthase|uniref:Lipid-A-disaccharide synthase n=1 Tax=Cyanomargarita calcarea GSE-NOS-MK-12-04C TaxID=2839659 RepID=A0A951UR88_9CYAN|nr:lipid-A-disaccharide synthase [Cyanomargarita calcarea GSE-NOS-MK-12-04C]